MQESGEYYVTKHKGREPDRPRGISMRTFFLAAAIVAGVAPSAMAVTDAQVREFDVIGIKLGTSYDDIKNKFSQETTSRISRTDTLGPNGRRVIGNINIVRDESIHHGGTDFFEIDVLVTSGVTRLEREAGYKVTTGELIELLKTKYGEPDKQEHIERQPRYLCSSIGPNPPDCRERDVLIWGDQREGYSRKDAYLEVVIYPQRESGYYPNKKYDGYFKTVLHDPKMNTSLTEGNVYKNTTPTPPAL